MKTGPRHLEVDLLRGLAMLGMIVIHTNAFFLTHRVAFFIWDASQFAVVAFIFCSAYVFFQKGPIFTLRSALGYIKKRLIRLLVPYYLFLSVILSLTMVKELNKITAPYLLQSIFIAGGVDINWLVLLFLMFAILFPIIVYLRRRWPRLFLLYLALALMSSFLLLFYHPGINYRFIMWLPWSLVALFAWYFIHNERSSKFFTIGTPLFFILFLSLRILEQRIHRSLIMFDNKYPPNLYHLSYGFLIIMLIWPLLKRGLLNFFPAKRLLIFLSVNSYSVYFIHFVIMYLLTVFFRFKFTWPTFFLVVFFATLLIQFLSTKIYHLFSKAKSGPTI